MKKSKPTPEQIRRSTPLTASRGVDPPLTCCVCGGAFACRDLPPTLHREHDEHDRPIAGDGALVFLGRDANHAGCLTALDRHPRLYSEETGAPGHFPALCGECVHRRGLSCAHPDLKANGGPGLRVRLTGMGAVIICTRYGCHTPIRRATDCAGQKLRGE